jgi:hypothetical protein
MGAGVVAAGAGVGAGDAAAGDGAAEEGDAWAVGRDPAVAAGLGVGATLPHATATVVSAAMRTMGSVRRCRLGRRVMAASSV